MSSSAESLEELILVLKAGLWKGCLWKVDMHSTSDGLSSVGWNR